ncbi:MAG: magnesium transporter, partial [Cetobacterium sp.]
MLKKQIDHFLVTKNYFQLKTFLNDSKAVDIADFIEENNESILIIFRLLNKDVSAEVFSHLSSAKQREIVDSIQDKKLKEILDELFLDDIVDFVEEMPANVVKRILANSTEEERILINQLLSYNEDSAGSLMTVEYISMKKEWTVKEAIKYIRDVGTNSESIDSSYVTSNSRQLEGVVSLRDLLLAKDNETISDIMKNNVISIHTYENREKALELFKKYDLLVLPVVDKEEKLVGIITIDDAVDAIEEENTEDFQKMAALTPSKEEYLESSVLSLSKHRLLWLLVLMVSATFTGAIISKYEGILESMVVLAASIPMLMDTGGNAGSQSSTLIIRGMALGHIEMKDYLKVVWKEFRVSLLVGFGLASINFIRMFYLIKTDYRISIVVS